jgi:hypothetical protein
MVRTFALLTFALGVLLTLCAPALAAGKAPVGVRPSQPPDVVTLTRTAIDAQGRAWVTGRTAVSAATLVWYRESGAWHALPAPPPRTDLAFVPLATDDVWVGSGARLAHWDGSSWTVTPHPPVAGLDVLDMTAAAADDVWAVGRRNGIVARLPGDGAGERTQLQKPVTLHWDGQAWKVVPIPALPGVDQSLDAVACGPSGVWAVGRSERLTNPEDVGSPSASPAFKDLPLVLRWRAGAWRRVEHTDYGRRGTYLVDVAVSPAGSPWIVGVVQASAFDGKWDRWYTLVEERTGASWTRRQASTYRWRALPRAIAAPSASDVWVAFSDKYGDPGIEHWDGQAWVATSVDQLGWTPGLGSMVGIPDVAADATSAWLVGGLTTLADESDVTGDPLVWSYGADGWTRIPFALP